MSEQDKEVLEQDENAQTEDEAVDEIIETPSTEDKGDEPKSDDKKSDEGESKERPIYTMPVSKAQEEKRRAVEKAKEEAKVEAQAEMQALRDEYEAKLKTTQSDQIAFNEKLKAVAEKHGLKTEAAADLLGVFKELATPDLSKYDKILKEHEMQSHKMQASKEFDEKVLPLIQKDFPNVTSKHIQKVKDEITKLAFTNEYHTYHLEDIYTVKKGDYEFKNGYSSEPAGGHSTEIVNFETLTAKQEHELADKDPEGYKKYLNYMRQKGSRYLD